MPIYKDNDIRETTWANRGDPIPYVGKETYFSDIKLTGYSNGVRWIVPGALNNFTNEILVKPSGLAVTLGNVNTFHTAKIAAPGDFDAVRLVIYHHDPSVTTVYKAIVAVTETALQDTDINRWRPVVGGVEYSGLNQTDNYGWHSETWAGAATITPAAGAATVPVIGIGDWIPLASVPRSDGEPFPFVLVRFHVASGNTSTVTSSALMDQKTTANGGFILQAAYGSTTGTFITAPVGNNPSGALFVDKMLTFGVQFRTRKAGISLITIGDSLTQNSFTTASGLNSMGLRTAAAISRLGTPCGYINNGAGGETMTSFAATSIAAISAFKPTVALIQGGSPNGPNIFAAAAAMRDTVAKQANLIRSMEQACINAKVTPIVSTWVPMAAAKTPDATTDNMRIAHNAEILSKCANPIDFNALVTTATAPARIAAAYDYGDTIHVNEAGIELEATTLTNKIQAIHAIG